MITERNQSDQVVPDDILGALSTLLKTVNETYKLSSKPLEQWAPSQPLRGNVAEGGVEVYPCQELKRYKKANDYYKDHYGEDCTLIS